MNTKGGIVVEVLTSPRGGVPKYVQEKVILGTHGLLEDYHNREMRPSFSKPGTMKPNTDRHITIVGEEAIKNVNRKLSIQLGPGALGENILTRGLGDLWDILPHSTIRIGNNIVLRVMEQNQPCPNLVHYHPHFNKTITGSRGLLCAIEKGVGEIIRPGDLIVCLPRNCTECGRWMNGLWSSRSTYWKCSNCGNTFEC